MVNSASSFSGVARGGGAPPYLVLRADAGGLQGSGHVMRCLALAQAWIAQGGSATLATIDPPAPLAARAAAAGVAVAPIVGAQGTAQDAAATRALANGASALVIDGYHFDAAFMAAVADAAPTCAIDDAGRLSRYPVRWILNQNAHAHADLYATKADGATLLLGGAFALLRPEFMTPPTLPRRGLFATFGGVDPHGASEKFLDAVAAWPRPPNDAVTLAIGAANVRAVALEARAAQIGVIAARDVRDMAARFSAAALVVTAGGSTLWEGCACGAPMLVVSVIPEEAESAAALAARGGCRYVGALGDLATEAWTGAIAALWGDGVARDAMGASARALVDGQGAARVAALLRDGATPR